jgi:hypothetical protein
MRWRIRDDNAGETLVLCETETPAWRDYFIDIIRARLERNIGKAPLRIDGEMTWQEIEERRLLDVT